MRRSNRWPMASARCARRCPALRGQVVLLDRGRAGGSLRSMVRDAADKPVDAALARRGATRCGGSPATAAAWSSWSTTRGRPNGSVRLDGLAVQLVPGSGWPRGPGCSTPPALRPTAHTSDPYKNAKLALEAIARATNLVRLASQDPSALCGQFGEGSSMPSFSPCRPGRIRPAKRLAWQDHGKTIAAGTGTVLELVNRSPLDVDVTAFYVDSHYGITPVFPMTGTGEPNRLKAEEARQIVGEIEGSTLGNEHFIVLAVRSEAQRSPVDLSPLGQPPLEEVVSGGRSPTSLADRRRGAEPLSPMEELLATTLNGHGTTRGWTRRLGQYSMKAISFQVTPAK